MIRPNHKTPRTLSQTSPSVPLLSRTLDQLNEILIPILQPPRGKHRLQGLPRPLHLSLGLLQRLTHLLPPKRPRALDIKVKPQRGGPTREPRCNNILHQTQEQDRHDVSTRLLLQQEHQVPHRKHRDYAGHLQINAGELVIGRTTACHILEIEAGTVAADEEDVVCAVAGCEGVCLLGVFTTGEFLRGPLREGGE